MIPALYLIFLLAVPAKQYSCKAGETQVSIHRPVLSLYADNLDCLIFLLSAMTAAASWLWLNLPDLHFNFLASWISYSIHIFVKSINGGEGYVGILQLFVSPTEIMES